MERRSDGALEVQGYLTKTGVYEYQRGDTVVRELRSDSEVFAEDALDSLQGSFVTVDHPKDFLNTETWRTDAVGVVSHVKVEPPYVAGKMRIWDAGAIHMVESGYLREVSCGYACVPMTLDSGEADIAQTNIRFNHVAIGPEKWGRLGSDVALRLDSNGQEVLIPFEAPNGDTMEDIQEAIGPVLEAIKGLEAKYDSLSEALAARQDAEEASPINRGEVLPEPDQIQALVDKQARDMVAMELKARDAADEIFGWRYDSHLGRDVRNEKFWIEPTLCARQLCEEVLQTVDSSVTIGAEEDLTPYVREAELLAKRARQDRLSRLSTVDSIQSQLTGMRASRLETPRNMIANPRSDIRAHIFGTPKEN